MSPTATDLTILFRQLESLRRDISQVTLGPGRATGIAPYATSFNALLARVRAALADDALALAAIADVRPAVDVSTHVSLDYHMDAKQTVMLGAGHLLAVLESKLQPAVQVPAMKLDREGVYFAGQYFDALQKASAILTSAKTSIVVIDGYLGREVFDLLSAKAPGVEVRILTKPKPLTNAVVVLAEGFKKQYPPLEVRTSEAFHDRFVIIDDADFYHFGASLKDVGHRGFMFSRIEEPLVIDALRAAFSKEWAAATARV